MSARSNAGRIGVYGASGSGKSAYTKQRIGKLRRVVVFDPLAEYDMRQTNDLDEVRKAMVANWDGFRIAYRPPPAMESAALSGLCRLLMRAQQPFQDGASTKGMTLVVEELNLAFPVAGGSARCPGFAAICSRGRHWGIEVFGISQRIAEIDTRFRGNCTETVAFRQKGARDRDTAAVEIGCKVGDLPGDNLLYLQSAGGKWTGPHKLTFK